LTLGVELANVISPKTRTAAWPDADMIQFLRNFILPSRGQY
jgi:hypothetical protein